MKHIKSYKIFEAGEWSRDVDWDFVKENPDNESEEANWIRKMQDDLETIKEEVEFEDDIGEKVNFEIEDIRGHDMYQGPYGIIKINSDRYKIWFLGEYDGLYIENFPIDNCSEDGEDPGFKGNIDDIVEAILKQYKPINKEIRKFNL